MPVDSMKDGSCSPSLWHRVPRCVYARCMIKRSDIHTFEDEAFLRRTARLSAVAFIVSLGAGAAAIFALVGSGTVTVDAELAAIFTEENAGTVFRSYVAWFVIAAIATVASFAVHELVHGVCFKLLAPAGSRVTFGANWKRGMLYACANGVVYSRRRYLVIALAPTFVVTALLLGAGAVSGRIVAMTFAAVLHLTGCTGDWVYAEEIHRDPAIAYCMDTDWGVCFYAEDGLVGDGLVPAHRSCPRCAEQVGTNPSPSNPPAEGDAE